MKLWFSEITKIAVSWNYDFVPLGKLGFVKWWKLWNFTIWKIFKTRNQEEFKLADTRAEFAERSVDKLESTIDGLLESLMNEKMNFRNISEKLDKTLNDMMSMA